MDTLTQYDLLTLLVLKDRDFSSTPYTELKKIFEETKRDIKEAQPKTATKIKSIDGGI